MKLFLDDISVFNFVTWVSDKFIDLGYVLVDAINNLEEAQGNFEFTKETEIWFLNVGEPNSGKPYYSQRAGEKIAIWENASKTKTEKPWILPYFTKVNPMAITTNEQGNWYFHYPFTNGNQLISPVWDPDGRLIKPSPNESYLINKRDPESGIHFYIECENNGLIVVPIAENENNIETVKIILSYISERWPGAKNKVNSMLNSGGMKSELMLGLKKDGDDFAKNPENGDSYISKIPGRVGRRPKNILELQRHVMAWEKVKNQDSITLEEFLCETFGETPNGEPKVARSTFYDWRRKVFNKSDNKTD